MKKYYRVVKGTYGPYSVEHWRWYFPFWIECHGKYSFNFHSTLEEAHEFAENHSKGRASAVEYYEFD